VDGFEAFTMTPGQFLEQVVRPNMADFQNDDADMRHAYNAAAAASILRACSIAPSFL
jgi:hypothetical protein